jgi:hypothetical protein
VAPHHAGDADVGGAGFGDRRLRQKNERLRMQRDILSDLCRNPDMSFRFI